MKSIFLPKKINVGFVNRNDTFTKKLAYVIYFDEKNKLRKEHSWNSWRDKSIDNEIYENIPQEGFVLNKKAGGYSSGWNHRQTYVRVYDPRGFEFEISIENLLYILENTNSIKGKGLEGKFIYGWSGSDLVLMPLSSPDYQEIKAHNEQLHLNKKIGVKDLVIGGTYTTKQNEDYVYMGKFDKWTETYKYVNGRYVYVTENKGKHHFFCRMYEYTCSYRKTTEMLLSTIMVKSPSGKFIGVVSEESPANFADIFEKLEKTKDFSPIDNSKDKYVPYTLDELKKKTADMNWGFSCYLNEDEVHLRYSKERDGIINISKDYHNSDKFALDSGTIEELYERNTLTYKNIYLANGTLYRNGKQ